MMLEKKYELQFEVKPSVKSRILTFRHLGIRHRLETTEDIQLKAYNLSQSRYHNYSDLAPATKRDVLLYLLKVVEQEIECLDETNEST